MAKYIYGKGKHLHRNVAEQALKRPLKNEETIHHVDYNTHNNTNKNLVICPDNAYHRILHQRTDCLNAGFNPNTHRRCSNCKTWHLHEDFSSKFECKESRSIKRKLSGENRNKFDWKARLAQQYRRVKREITWL